MSSPSLLWSIARHELLLAVRSSSTLLFGALFAVLAIAVAGSGYVLSGGSGFQDFARTSASLVELVILVVPLASLLMGVLAIAPEMGASELLYSQPVSRTTILLGKLLGLLLALSGAQLIGFGAAGLVVFSSSGSGNEGAGAFLLVVLGSILLTATFLAIAALIASGSVGRKTRALAMAVIVWFGAAILFELAALGIASVVPSLVASRVLIVAVLVNPIGAVRTGALLGIEGTTAFGAASLAFLRFTSGSAGAGILLSGSILLWLVLPTAAAARRLAKLDF